MEEKKFSLIILAFIFAVAIPSTIFLFSDTFSAGAYSAYNVPKIYTNLGGDPAPYSYLERGPAAPFIYAGTEVDYYEKKYPTQIPFEKPGYDFSPDRPLYDTEQIYTPLKQEGCPASYRKIPADQVAWQKQMGRVIEKFGDTYCWKLEGSIAQR